MPSTSTLVGGGVVISYDPKYNIIGITGNTSGTTGTSSATTLYLAGGNNITLSQVANTITISAGTNQDGFNVIGISGNTAGTSGTSSATTIYLAGGNNVTLSQNGNSISISGPNTVSQSQQTQNIVRAAVIDGNTSGTTASISSGTLVIAGGNNITLSQNGNAFTIDGVNTTVQTQQTQNIIRAAVIAGNTDGATSSISSGTLTLVGGNNITLSQAANVITINAPTVVLANVMGGNTSGTTASISSGTLVLAGGNNITLSQDGNAVTISACNTVAQSVQTGSIIRAAVIGGNTSGTTASISSGTLNLFGGNNVTLSQNAQSITISAFNQVAQSVQTQNMIAASISGNTSGTKTIVSSGTMYLAGGNNITLSQDGQSITISAANSIAQSVQTQNLIVGVIGGNTSGTTASVSSGTLNLFGGNNVTLSQNAQSITISVANSAAQSVQTQNLIVGVIGGNTSGTTASISSGTLNLFGGNNLTLSQNGQSVTLSVFNQTVQTQSRFNAVIGGNTSGTTASISSGTLNLFGGNNVTLSQDGNSITVSAVNTVAQSVQTGSIIRAAVITGNTSGTTASISSGTLNFAGGNNITLSQDGQSITISGPNIGADVYNIVGISGNTSGTTGTSAATTVYFAGGNNVTLSQDGNTITISACNTVSQSVQTGSIIRAAVIGGNTSGTTASISSGTLNLIGGNNITLSQEGQSITVSAHNQSVQTQNMIAAIISGNTSGTTASVSSGTFVLAGGNNVTLSQDGQSVTISVPTQSAQTNSIIRAAVIGGNTSGTTASISSGTLNLFGGNNVTLSQNAQSITISAAAQSVQTQNLIVGVIAGNTSGTTASVSSGTLNLAGGNNITLSQNGQSITISAANTVAQSVQTQNMIAEVIGGNTSGTTASISSGTLNLFGGNNITLSQNAQSITISAFNQTVQTQSRFNAVIGGNTSGTTASVSSGILNLFGGNNVTLSQDGNSITVSAVNTVAQSVQTGSIVRAAIIGGNTSGTTASVSSGTLNFFGGNNVTLSQDGQSITISGPTVGADVYNIVGISGNTSGTTGTSAATTVYFAGGNNVTLSQNGNTITISACNTVAQSTQTQNMIAASISGNTSGTKTVISSGTMYLAGGNNVTLSQDGQSITISAFSQTAQSVQTQNLIVGVIGGNTSGTTASVSSGTLTLAGGNNITLSQNGNAVTISACNTVAQSVQTQNMIAGSISGNTSGTKTVISSGTMYLAGGNNITLSQDGQSITISAFSQTAQSVQTQNLIVGVIGGNTSGTTASVSSGTLNLFGGNNVTLSQDGNSITVSAVNTVAQSVQTGSIIRAAVVGGNTSGTTASISSGTLNLAGGNNITLSQDGQSITISAFNQVAQSVQTQNLLVGVIGGNTSGTTASVSSGTLNLFGGNNITLSQNAQSVTISAPTQSVQTQSRFNAVIGGNTSGTTASVSSGTLNLFGGNNVTLSQEGNSITISGPTVGADVYNIVGISGNTSGTTGTSVATTVYFAGGNNVTLSQNGNTITISACNTVAQSAQTDNIIRAAIIGGNTSGTTVSISSGTLNLFGGNNVTLSQNAQSITISVANSVAQSVQTQNLIVGVIGGNTSGTTASISSGTLNLFGGNNVVLSQNAQSITISASNQSVQTQNMIAGSISGNTSGTKTVISSGTMYLAGGNNITLSQDGQSVTISAFNQVAQSAQTDNIIRAAVIGGNTSGTTASISSGTLNLFGGNNVVLSQNAQSITISASNQTVQTQNMIAGSISGNTSGTKTIVSSGTMYFAGGNNITLSQDGQSVTISAFAQTVQTQNMIAGSISGNTSGTKTIISSGTMYLAGGNNITLSQNAQSITISACNTVAQTVQTQNMIAGSISGNTSGTKTIISSGTMYLAGGNNITLSQNAQSITISACNTVAQTVQTQNMIAGSISGNTSGTKTIISSGTMYLAGGNNITLSQNGQSITISGGAGGAGVAIVISGNTSGTTASVSSGTMTLFGGTNITVVQDANSITINAGTGAGAVPKILNIPAGDFVLIHDTNFAPPETLTGANISQIVHAFDRTTVMYVRHNFQIPTDINTGGNVIFKFYWKPRVHPNPAQDVVWNVDSVAVNDNESYDTALANKGTVTGTSKTTSTNISVTSLTLAVSTLGWAPEDMVTLRFCRNSASGSDTLDDAATAADDDALLFGIKLEIPRT